MLNHYFSTNVRTYISKYWESWQKGDEIHKIAPEDKDFNKKVSFFEAITESLCQLGLSSFIFKVFGISKTSLARFVQYFSLTMSISSLTVSFISVSNILKTVLNIK